MLVHRCTILIGLCMHFLGHTGLWMVATGRITLAYWQVSTRAQTQESITHFGAFTAMCKTCLVSLVCKAWRSCMKHGLTIFQSFGG